MSVKQKYNSTYYNKHKDELIIKNKQLYADNKAKRIEQAKQRYDNVVKNDKVHCDICNRNVGKYRINKHNETKLHKRNALIVAN